MTAFWASEAIFYHIFPLGLCDAPKRNDFTSPPVARLEKLYPWLDHAQNLGATALYLGPLFESSAHGYDTADYYQVDRRLGENATLAAFAREVHQRGMRLVLDGVFNHVGRDFWAFRDVQRYREQSSYASWFHNLNFQRSSPYGDPFSYEGWSGNYDLVKLNTAHPHVRSHLFDAVGRWVEWYGIDGLRLDAADQLAPDFLDALGQHCRGLRDDFWLMGEIVFGDYRSLVQPQRLDSATNYEVYKSLYSSHAEHNFFELAYALKRQFGAQGIYRGLPLYSFADNHDVNRVVENLGSPAQLYPLYTLLFSMPGVPSVYYGSEWGLGGRRTRWEDGMLRPALEVNPTGGWPHPDLAAAIQRLARLRRSLPALMHGDYSELAVAADQLAFSRATPAQTVIVAVNAADKPASLELRVPLADGWLYDRLNPGERFAVSAGRVRLELPSCWGRVLTL